MLDRFILSPYFLDTHQPALIELAGDEWRVVRIDLPDGDLKARLTAIHERIAAEVIAAVNEGERPVVLADDCCATLGVMAGLQRAGQEAALIWIDAHGDFNTYETTPSGFLGGMPLAMAVGLGEQALTEGVGLRPWPERKVTLVDARDLDPGEQENVSRSRISHLPDIEMLLRPGGLPDGPLYVHFDSDVIDPGEAPAMSYPAPGGPTAETVRDVLRALAATHRVVAISVTLWTPALDEDGVTGAVVMGAVNSLVGR
jgi:arginase